MTQESGTFETFESGDPNKDVMSFDADQVRDELKRHATEINKKNGMYDDWTDTRIAALRQRSRAIGCEMALVWENDHWVVG